MNKKLLMTSIVAASLAIAGCTTTFISPDDARDMMPMNFGTKSATENASVTIVRDSGLLGAAVTMVCFVNGVPAVSLYSSEKSTIYLKPDQYSVMCQGGGARPETIFIRVEPNSQILLRVGFAGTNSFVYQSAKDGVWFSTDVNAKPMIR